MAHSVRLCIVGVNEFTQRLAQKALEQDVLTAQNILIVDKEEETLRTFDGLGVKCSTDAASMLVKAEIVVLGNAKKGMSSALAPICALTRGRVLISLAQGVDCAYILERVAKGTHVMTAVAGQADGGGIHTVITYSRGFPDHMKTACVDLFKSVGTVEENK